MSYSPLFCGIFLNKKFDSIIFYVIEHLLKHPKNYGVFLINSYNMRN